VSRPVCGQHDTAPSTAEENQRMEDGWDPCIAIVRIWFN
jgi:hypothetical protein